jgi:EAL domain-containing protein (putative c-di-GMP-specific phosphodiesterase class I)
LGYKFPRSPAARAAPACRANLAAAAPVAVALPNPTRTRLKTQTFAPAYAPAEATASGDTLDPPAARRDFSAYAHAYSEGTGKLLRRVREPLQQATAEYARDFYEQLAHQPANAAIVARLAPDERTHLQQRQTDHLSLILSPRLTPQEHFERARRVGRVHEMVGLDVPSLLEAYQHYQQKVFAKLPDCGLGVNQQELLRRALIQRLMLDFEAQSVSHYEVGLETVALMSELDRVIQGAGTLTDLLQGAAEALCTLDGILACLISRSDAQGYLQTEAAGGVAGRQYAEGMQRQSIPLIRTLGDFPTAQGPGGRAWHSSQIQICESCRQDPSWAPWREVGVPLGFRSSAGIPLLDESGQPFALLGLYSRWPGFFNAPSRRGMLSHIQQTMSHAVLRHEQLTVIPVRARQTYRQQLHAGAVRMLYQPIIDLRDGTMRHVEALARLRAADGTLLSPGLFLPAFTNSDLLQLFRLGLARVCRDCRSWADRGLAPSVSINLPAEAITQDAYRDALFEILARESLGTERIQLEILESSDPIDPEKRDARIAEFRRAGVRIIQDDLGSGHSSLLRMDRIAFDAVKIDQGLVRNAIEEPRRALEFIFHLTRLVRGFGLPVTVEGLEDPAMIEAVAILGADYGQGYAIARPMDSSDLAQWRQGFSYRIDPKQPRTALGALAGYLLWDQQRDILTPWPDLVEYFSHFPCLVHRYIENQGMQGSRLQSLLDENLRLATYGSTHPSFQRTRNELMALLGQEWARSRVR